MNQKLLPLYKSTPPFMDFKGGFGFQGVVLIDEVSGKIQCHICGMLHHGLNRHIRHKHNEMTVQEYKDMTGLNKHTPLVSPDTQTRLRQPFLVMTAQEREVRLKPLLKASKSYVRKGKSLRGKARTQEKNLYGTCDLQVKHRVNVEMIKHGRIPTMTELGSTLTNLIFRRFPSYEAALKTWGFSDEEITAKNLRSKQKIAEGKARYLATADLFNEDKVKKALLRFYEREKRLPTWGECGKNSTREMKLPGRNTIIRVLGVNSKAKLERLLNV